MRNGWLIAIALLLSGSGVAGGDGPAPGSSFVRVVQHQNNLEDQERLIAQTSVRELRQAKSGMSVVLLSVAPDGKREYFRSLTRYLRDVDLVLAEGTRGQPQGKRLKDEELPAERLWDQRYFAATARILGCELQHEWETSVVDSRWVLADMDTKQLLATMKSHETARPKKVAEDRRARIRHLERLAKGGSQQEIAHARDRIARLQMVIYSKMGPGSPWMEKRVRVMWQAVKKHLTSGKYKRVALVYSGWNAHKLEPRLVKELGFKLHASSWHDFLDHKALADEKPNGR